MSILGTPLNFDATPTQSLTWTLETGATGVIIEVGHEQGNSTRQIASLSGLYVYGMSGPNTPINSTGVAL